MAKHWESPALRAPAGPTAALCSEFLDSSRQWKRVLEASPQTNASTLGTGIAQRSILLTSGLIRRLVDGLLEDFPVPWVARRASDRMPQILAG